MRLLIFSVLLSVQAALTAVDGLNADMSLNRTRVSGAFFEGDFPLVTEALETFRKENPKPDSADKFFVYRYLGVIYAYRPETRAKAESYLYQLLKLNPNAELVDLYISDSIEAVFNKVRDRYEKQNHVSLKKSAVGNKKNNPAPADPSAARVAPIPMRQNTSKTGKPESSGGNSWVWWTAGAVGVAAAVTGYYYFAASPDPKPVAHDTIFLK